MPFKGHGESDELKMLRILNVRMELSEDEYTRYLNLERGYEGHVRFDLLTEKIQSECYILNDLRLKVNSIHFKIDTVIIYQQKIYLFLVRNYEGNYCFYPDRIEAFSGKEIRYPLDELQHSKSLLQKLLQNLGCNLSIEAYVVFINSHFTLYQVPPNTPFIFPAQLNRFMKKLNKQPSWLNNNHQELAVKILSLHQTETPNIPHYEYNRLKKGKTCRRCNSFSHSIKGKSVVCNGCGCEENVESAVLQCVDEIKLLFPNVKLTTNIVHDWCGKIASKKRISRILSKNFNIVGVHQWAFYE
ncbi:nuclease-related domain-containing protein [Paenibacillus sp. BSR1-1]|uniref:nuclease-related domain-containing protein n=1 Tax=Paenibacillus sp. BSR1-1 TaxID=3020845 RepID=UPI0025AF0FC3|nr:nuclease-related domain-containing protein [Paenibacillus sp. BSR1-1]MDN3018122.1 nuclease-related domain-containing protein [Paenibacillus sp. BSR1-1]